MQRDAGHAGMPNARGSQRGTCQCSCLQWPQRMQSPSAAGAARGRLRRLSQGASGDTPPPSPTAPALELVPVAAEPAAIAPARHTWAAAGCAVSGFVAARAGQPVSYLKYSLRLTAHSCRPAAIIPDGTLKAALVRRLVGPPRRLGARGVRRISWPPGSRRSTTS